MRAFNKSIILLSIQEVLSCGGPAKFADGCKQGFYSDAYDYASKFGVGPRINYPY